MSASSRMGVSRGAVVVLTACASIALGQQSDSIRQVQQVWGDSNPLSTSLHRPPDRLGPVTQFQGVFRDPAEPGKLFRYDNGITAVFDQSVYAPDGYGGAMPLIPPGTVFRLGARPAFGFGTTGTHATPNLLADGLRVSRTADVRGGRVDRSIAAARPTQPSLVPPVASDLQSAPAERREPITMWTDESMRQSRVARLFTMAHGG